MLIKENNIKIYQEFNHWWLWEQLLVNDAVKMCGHQHMGTGLAFVNPE